MPLNYGLLWSAIGLLLNKANNLRIGMINIRVRMKT